MKRELAVLIAHDEERRAERARRDLEEHEHHERHREAHDDDRAGGGLLRFELTAVNDGESRVSHDRIDPLANRLDEIAEVTEDRLGQDSRYWLDSSAIKDAVGWEPEIDWDEGLAEMVDWGRTYLDDIRDRDTGYTLRG